MEAKSATLSRFPSSDNRMTRSKSRLACSCGVIELMSTAGAPPAAAVGAGGVVARPARWAANITTTVTRTRTPTTQGKLLEGTAATTRWFFASRAAITRCGSTAPAGAPHSWQNFAPGVSPSPQTPQRASPTTAPHSVQKRPDAGVPHDGQGIGGAELDWGVPGEAVIRSETGY